MDQLQEGFIRCDNCKKVVKVIRCNQKFCSTRCGSKVRSKSRAGKLAKYPPMKQSQAQANAFLMGRSNESVDDLINGIFGRPIEKEGA